MGDTNPTIPEELPDTLDEQLQLAYLIQLHFAEYSLDFLDNPDFTNDRRTLGEATEKARHGNSVLLKEILKLYIEA